MKKLGKKAGSAYETFSAYACICNCSSCSNCNCGLVGGATNRYYSVLNSSNTSRTSSRTV